MMVWCYVGAAGMWALTTDEAGSNLPASHAPWRLLKTATLTGTDPDERQAEELIGRHGFCCFDPFAQNLSDLA